MINFDWIERKKLLFSEILVSKFVGREADVKIFSQENSASSQNKYNVKTDTWNDLLLASSDINPLIKTNSDSIFPFGLEVKDDLGQIVLNKAHIKIIRELEREFDIDEDILKDAIYKYIVENNLLTKGLYTLVKKLKNLSLENLQDLSE